MAGFVECYFDPHSHCYMVELVECMFGPHGHLNLVELVENTFLLQCLWDMVTLLNILFSVMVIVIW